MGEWTSESSSSHVPKDWKAVSTAQGGVWAQHLRKGLDQTQSPQPTGPTANSKEMATSRSRNPQSLVPCLVKSWVPVDETTHCAGVILWVLKSLSAPKKQLTYLSLRLAFSNNSTLASRYCQNHGPPQHIAGMVWLNIENNKFLMFEYVCWFAL
jgi:hypothetical protein